MTDHAHELRRYARKIAHPDGDVPAVMLAAADEIERLRTENAGLVDDMDLLRDNNTALLARIEQMEKQEPVAWRTFDGEGGYDYRSYEDNENYKLGWDARNPNHIGWVEPLYALPGAQGESE